MPPTPRPPDLPLITAAACWTEGLQFVTTASSGHSLVLDADRAHNSGPSPMEMVLMGLCGCSATDVVIILGKARQTLTRLAVSATGKRSPTPPNVYTEIHMQYRVQGRDLDAVAVERAVELSHEKYCSVLLMLNRTATISRETLVEP